MKTDKVWIHQKLDETSVRTLAQKAQIPPLLARVFLNRGISDLSYIHDFLHPDFSKVSHPFLLKDMEKAAARIAKAITHHEKILIYGDYDVDGITSTSILYTFLQSLQAEPCFYIPDRIEEGYGLSQTALDNALLQSPDLIVTVDCGIVSFDEVAYVTSKGVDIVVTDHHACRDQVPLAHAVVNPHQKDCGSPFKPLAGVGVTFKLIWGICDLLHLGTAYLNYLDLVSLGTVADVVSLTGENRIIVSEGLKRIAKNPNMGLRALMEVTGIQDKEVNAYSLAFVLAPRINAAGRLGDPGRAVALFTTHNMQLAQNIAIDLNDENKRRQDTETEILERALLEIESDPAYREEPILVVWGKRWHHGVIGIVSSRITERYYKPSIIISAENGTAKGSARSIPDFSIVEALHAVSDLLTRYGGHTAAAGLSLNEADLPELRRRINTYAKTRLRPVDLMPKLFIDTEIPAKEITKEAVKTMELLSPFGQDNPKPLFMVKDMTLTQMRTLSENRHLKLQVSGEGLPFDVIGFHMGSLAEKLSLQDTYDIAFFPEINLWNHVEKVQFQLKDIRKRRRLDLDKEFTASMEKQIAALHTADWDSLTPFPSPLDPQTSILSPKALKDLLAHGKTLFLADTRAAAEEIAQQLQMNHLPLRQGLELYFECLPPVLPSPEPQAILLLHPHYADLSPEVYGKIIFVGPMLWKPGLLDFIAQGSVPSLGFYPVSQSQEELDLLTIQRKDVASVYKYFTLPGHNKIVIRDLQTCAKEISEKADLVLDATKLLKILRILDELAIVTLKYNEKYNIILNIPEKIEKKDLENSNLFQIYRRIKWWSP